MSREVYELRGLFVTRFAGPSPEGPDRRRWQITMPLGVEYVQLTATELEALVDALREDLEPSCAR